MSMDLNIRFNQDYPSQSYLRELFNYNDGYLVWSDNAHVCVRGRIAGTSLDGKLGYISHKRRIYKTSRLVWIYHHGDVRNGISVVPKNNKLDDNRIENLKLVTPQGQPYTKLALRGYFFQKSSNKWVSQLFFNNEKVLLGLFDTMEEAKAVHLKAKKKYHVELEVGV